MTEDEEKAAVARLMALRPGQVQNVILEVGERGPTVYLEWDMGGRNFTGHWCDGETLDAAVKAAERYIAEQLPSGGAWMADISLLIALILIVLFACA